MVGGGFLDPSFGERRGSPAYLRIRASCPPAADAGLEESVTLGLEEPSAFAYAFTSRQMREAVDS